MLDLEAIAHQFFRLSLGTTEAPLRSRLGQEIRNPEEVDTYHRPEFHIVGPQPTGQTTHAPILTNRELQVICTEIFDREIHVGSDSPQLGHFPQWGSVCFGEGMREAYENYSGIGDLLIYFASNPGHTLSFSGILRSTGDPQSGHESTFTPVSQVVIAHLLG